MTQSGIVVELLPDGMASVSVQRQSACGGNCASCGGCSYKQMLTAVADNRFGAKIGDKVVMVRIGGYAYDSDTSKAILGSIKLKK